MNLAEVDKTAGGNGFCQPGAEPVFLLLSYVRKNTLLFCLIGMGNCVFAMNCNENEEMVK